MAKANDTATQLGIDTVIFDLGGVLIDYQPQPWLNRRFPDEGETKGFSQALYQSFFGGPFRDRWDRGDVDTKGAVLEFLSLYPQLAPYMDQLISEYRAQLFPAIPRSIKRLQQLKERGYRLCYLSNYPQDDFISTRDQHDFFSLFDGGVVSYQERVGKPDLAIYQILIDRYNIAAKKAVFVDDREDNTAAARAVGMHTITFTDASQLDAYFGL